jgi:hypothetical protein
VLQKCIGIPDDELLTMDTMCEICVRTKAQAIYSAQQHKKQVAQIESLLNRDTDGGTYLVSRAWIEGEI